MLSYSYEYIYVGYLGTSKGYPGVYVPVDETITGFKEILEGKHDSVSEDNFYMKAGIDSVEKS